MAIVAACRMDDDACHGVFEEKENAAEFGGLPARTHVLIPRNLPDGYWMKYC